MLAKIIEGFTNNRRPSAEDVLSEWLVQHKPVVKHLSTAVKGNMLYITVLYEERKEQKKAERERGPEKPGEAPACTRCGGSMVRRERRADGHPFWGCTKFPECKGIVNFDALDLEAERRRQSPDEPEFGGQGGYEDNPRTGDQGDLFGPDDSDDDQIPF